MDWKDLVRQVEANVDKDPCSDFGIAMGKRCMDWVNTYYGKNHVSLRNAIWEKGFKEGQIDDKDVLSIKGFTWLDQAITAYYKGRIFTLLNQINTHSEEIVMKQWEALLTDMCGDEQALKNDIINTLMNDENNNEIIKNWLKKMAVR